MNKVKEIALKKRAMQLMTEKRYVEARAAVKKLLKAFPADVECWFALGQLQVGLGEFEFAVESFDKACQSPSPILPVALEKAVDVCIQHLPKKSKLGIVFASKLVKLKPESARAHFCLGFFLFNLRLYLSAEANILKAVELDPENVLYLNYCGQLYTYTAQIEKALYFYGKTLKINPHDRQASLCRLMTYNYADGVDEAVVIDAHRQFGVTLEKQFAQLESFSKPKNRQSSRIRLGYVSQDFKAHSVAYFFKALIENYSKERFEVTCYSDVEAPDQVTEEIKCKADHWCDSRLMSDEQLYKQVRLDQIDILVDLVGYAGASRAGVFARKAAPIQVIYLGYPNTSGLSRMDFRITDEWSDPAECKEKRYTETLVRLPSGFLCYSPNPDAPKVGELPAMRDGKGLRFGSFNSFQKISPQMLKVWAKILSAVHGSTLLIKAQPLHEKMLCERVWLAFEAEGIDRARIELSSWTFDVCGHLENYSQVDIHLDTFPYNGTTTIFEGLWQGVPTITLAGDSHRSRVGLSILTQVGLADFVASSEQQYIDLAVRKSKDLVALAELRRELRGQLYNSPLMDRTRFISELERCYEDMYSTLPDVENDTDL